MKKHVIQKQAMERPMARFLEREAAILDRPLSQVVRDILDYMLAQTNLEQIVPFRKELVNVTFNMTHEEKEKLDLLARNHGLSRQQVIDILLSYHIYSGD